MLLIGRQRQRTCQTLSRRSFLQAGGSTVLGLSLADLLRLRAEGKAAHGPARSVLFLWLWGGPAQLDTWDPKPNAPLEFRGPFTPIATKTTGIRICELFPKLAQLTSRAPCNPIFQKSIRIPRTGSRSTRMTWTNLIN